MEDQPHPGEYAAIRAQSEYQRQKESNAARFAPPPPAVFVAGTKYATRSLAMKDGTATLPAQEDAG